MNSSTTTRVGVIAGVAAVLLTAIWYLALFRPESDHLKSAHAARVAAEAQIQTLNGQVAGLKALEKQIPQDTARLHVLQQALPNTPDLPDALGQLHNAATQSGITLSSLSPTAPATSSGGATQQSTGPAAVLLSMSATGNYPQLMNFMIRLDNMARTVVVNTVSLNSATSGGSLTATLNAQIFYAP